MHVKNGIPRALEHNAVALEGWIFLERESSVVNVRHQQANAAEKLYFSVIGDGPSAVTDLDAEMVARLRCDGKAVRGQ
jgi:sirohydrochlorin ferrochelatase